MHGKTSGMIGHLEQLLYRGTEFQEIVSSERDGQFLWNYEWYNLNSACVFHELITHVYSLKNKCPRLKWAEVLVCGECSLHFCVLAEGEMRNVSQVPSKKGLVETLCPLLAVEPPPQIASKVPKLLIRLYIYIYKKIYIIFSYPLLEDLYLKMLGLVDFLSNSFRRFHSSRGLLTAFLVGWKAQSL